MMFCRIMTKSSRDRKGKYATVLRVSKEEHEQIDVLGEIETFETEVKLAYGRESDCE